MLALRQLQQARAKGREEILKFPHSVYNSERKAGA